MLPRPMNFWTRPWPWFGDAVPGLGTAWEKGERLAKLVAQRRTLLVLDGLEPLQHPPRTQEGRVRVQALLRRLAAFNRGLCVITTRMAVADLGDQEGTSAPRRDLEHLSSDAGAKLLRALGVNWRKPFHGVYGGQGPRSRHRAGYRAISRQASRLFSLLVANVWSRQCEEPRLEYLGVKPTARLTLTL